ncbi:phage tail protein [Yersinia intermedia]|uniref:phage tail protein n=1 Tax=Yersinia intermedia TaxID=631 RepID=UPI001CFC7174|nr:phage tail protein [Yersinia intermedia]MCB5329266.1 phage tail protein [Yersinia intermedia]
MALTLLSANNASTVLAAGISASATTLTVNTGTGGLFPSPVSGTSFFKLTLIDAATGTLTEIVHVTARTGDTMTIVRGQEGTVSRLWSANDIAANMMTAGTLDLFAQSGTLGGAALLNVGTTAGTVAAGNDGRITGALQKSANLSDLANAQTALTNLGVPSSSLVPIGVPLPYPLATPPTGFLKCNGLSFSTATYPKLALAYPSGVLPDLRGEFLRGWDDGRGVDAGRALLSLKLDTLQGHKHTIIDSANTNYTGANSRVGPSTFGGIQYVDNAGPNSVFQASTMITNGTNGTPRVDSETSPRNIAFNYIVRAA